MIRAYMSLVQRFTALVSCAVVVVAIGLSVSLPVNAEGVQSPQDLMDSVSKQMFTALDANRSAIKKDPEKAYPLVDAILLPHFDAPYTARLVLATHWSAASADQRARFVQAFYHSLVRLYGGAIAGFTSDRLTLLPFRGDPTATEATVRTLVRRDSGATIPVDYRLHKTASGWMAYDVIIEGISYVKNYRTDLGGEIDAKGLDEVIARLEREGLSAPPGAVKGS